MNSSDGMDVLDLASLAEACDLECKAAQGRAAESVGAVWQGAGWADG